MIYELFVDIVTSVGIKTVIHWGICAVKGPWAPQFRGRYKNVDPIRSILRILISFKGGSEWWSLVYYLLFMSLKHLWTF